MKFGFIGCGNMQQAIMRGILQKNILPASDMFVTDRDPEKSRGFCAQTGTQPQTGNIELVQSADVVVLGTKPGDLPAVLREISTAVVEEHTVVSIAAGFPLALLKRALPRARAHVRIMPNTPCMVQAGVAGIYMHPREEAQYRLLRKIFSALGFVIEVDSDEAIDAITSASASGTGFVFQFMHDFQQWLESKGFHAADARAMTVEVFRGASELARAQASTSLEQLRINVTSKKGTTEAGLAAMAQTKVDGGIARGLEAAFKRSQEISAEAGASLG